MNMSINKHAKEHKRSINALRIKDREKLIDNKLTES